MSTEPSRAPRAAGADSGRRRGGTARVAGLLLAAGILSLPATGTAGEAATFDAARAFGARPSMWGLRLSPDGTKIAYFVPAKSRGTVLVTEPVNGSGKPHAAMSSTGDPLSLVQCDWVSNQRLVCQLHEMEPAAESPDLLPVYRWIAVDADGGNVKALAVRRNENSRGYLLNDGDVLDLLPDEDGSILMSRAYTPDTHAGSRLGSDFNGLGVDKLDTRTLAATNIVRPRLEAFTYLSDGQGTVRLMGVRQIAGTGYDRGQPLFLYRRAGSTDWKELGRYDTNENTGFWPVAVDHDLNLVYGLRRSGGHTHLDAIKLDGSVEEKEVYGRQDVDIRGVLTIGRRHRVIGALYSTDRPHAEIFDPEIKRVVASLARALPKQPLLEVRDASADEKTLVIEAGSDSDAGVYYLLDRTARHLSVFNVVRRELEGVKLAQVKSITYPSGDGVMVPAYLTLPPGRDDAHQLPAIVLPHGGPSYRDEWGFDWLVQYYANRGYAVIQPEFRGSAGYGDAWFQRNGFRSWRVAIDDVVAAGRWLVKEGIADPGKLAIVGWSYGGYAALQSVAVEPTLFKAAIAIAPVSDLAALVEERRNWSDFVQVRTMVGDGPQAREGSPIEHVKDIKVPVLLFHGTLDANVRYAESKHFAEKLAAAGGNVRLVTFDKLEHALDDADARADMLRQSDAFLQAAFAGTRN